MMIYNYDTVPSSPYKTLTTLRILLFYCGTHFLCLGYRIHRFSCSKTTSLR